MRVGRRVNGYYCDKKNRDKKESFQPRTLVSTVVEVGRGLFVGFFLTDSPSPLMESH